MVGCLPSQEIWEAPLGASYVLFGKQCSRSGLCPGAAIGEKRTGAK